MSSATTVDKTIQKWPCELKDNNYCSKECSNKANDQKGAGNPVGREGKFKRPVLFVEKRSKFIPIEKMRRSSVLEIVHERVGPSKEKRLGEYRE